MKEELLCAASGNQLSQEPDGDDVVRLDRDNVVRLDRKIHSL